MKIQFRTILLAIILATSAQAADASVPSKYPLPEKFNQIRQAVLNTIDDSQELGALSTYDILKDNLAAFRALNHKVMQAPHVDDVITHLSVELDIIASNFEKAAKLREVYAQNTENSQMTMTRSQRQINEALGQIDNRIASLQAQMQRARSTMGNGTQAGSNLSIEKARITLSANQSVLNSLQAQREIWQHFSHAQARLMQTFSASTERVDFVLFVLQKNAEVYREAANAAQLRLNVRIALDDLQTLDAIESAMVDLAESWREVDAIVDEIGNEEFANYASSK